MHIANKSLALPCLLMVKIRDEGHIQNKAIYVVLGVDLEGQKKVLGLWVAQSEGAKFWLQILTELKNRGVQDILIACVDGLKGFPEAIEAVYPWAEVQLCIVHLVRASLNYVPWKAHKEMATDLKAIYRAATAKEAEQQLQALETKWTGYPSVGQVWRRNWARIIPFFQYPPEIRRAIYTTNSVESLNRSLRSDQDSRRISQRRSRPEVVIFSAAASSQEVDRADSSLARSVEPFHATVARAHARAGTRRTVSSNHFSTGLWQGKGHPSPAPHPENQTTAVYTEELTHLFF
jgi:transposase-like protein